jgi:AcrR family transcriptional regulator
LPAGQLRHELDGDVNGRRPGRFAIPPPPEPDLFSDPIALAVIDLIAERGYEAVSVRLIVDRAGTTMGEFHLRFTDKQDATVQTMRASISSVRWTTETAYATGGTWREGLRAAAWAAADYIDRRPNLVYACVIGLLGAKNEMLRVVREECLMCGASLIERGRSETPDAPAGAGLMAMGSMAQLLTHRLQKGEPVLAHAMVPEMLYMSVRPYVGEEAAREELEAPRPVGSLVGGPAATG